MSKTLIGIVSSDKTDKTIVVTVAERKMHPLYKKQYTRSTKFMAHDEKNAAQPGDKVAIVECRPISKRKRFTLDKVLEKAGVEHKEAADIEAQAKPASKKKTTEEETQ